MPDAGAGICRQGSIAKLPRQVILTFLPLLSEETEAQRSYSFQRVTDMPALQFAEEIDSVGPKCHSQSAPKCTSLPAPSLPPPTPPHSWLWETPPLLPSALASPHFLTEKS